MKLRCQLSAAVEAGTKSEVVEIVERLTNLREFGMSDDVKEVRRLMNEAADLERRAKDVADRARDVAGYLIAKSRREWSDAEVAEVTGYDLGSTKAK